jgi:hypothetical protein
VILFQNSHSLAVQFNDVIQYEFPVSNHASRTLTLAIKWTFAKNNSNRNWNEHLWPLRSIFGQQKIFVKEFEGRTMSNCQFQRCVKSTCGC